MAEQGCQMSARCTDDDAEEVDVTGANDDVKGWRQCQGKAEY